MHSSSVKASDFVSVSQLNEYDKYRYFLDINERITVDIRRCLVYIMSNSYFVQNFGGDYQSIFNLDEMNEVVNEFSKPIIRTEFCSADDVKSHVRNMKNKLMTMHYDMVVFVYESAKSRKLIHDYAKTQVECSIDNMIRFYNKTTLNLYSNDDLSITDILDDGFDEEVFKEVNKLLAIENVLSS